MSEGDSLGSDKVKHLEFIQAIVARLGNSSFLIKGWALTVSAAFFAVLASRLSWKIAATGFIPLVAFWLLDAYYLRQERLFRLLYNDVCVPDGGVKPFSMDIGPYLKRVRAHKVIFSLTLRYFYGALVLVNLAFLAGAILHAVY
ncbi:hypothetical protein [Longispora urticae]